MQRSEPVPAITSQRDGLRDKLITLIGIASPSRSEQAIASFLAEVLGKLAGVSVARTGDNLVVTVASSSHHRPRLLLCGHLDTVPPQDNLAVRVDGDRVFGLGASDLKAGLAVFWQLLETVRCEALRYDPVFVLYAREEIAFHESGLIEVVAAHPFVRDAVFAICVEPTANHVELGCLGTLHARVMVHGESAHSARPWLGRNAIHLALPIAARVASYPERRVVCAEQPGIEYREVMNVTRIEGGRARNMIPDLAELNVNFRFAPDRSNEDACRVIRDLVAGAADVVFADVAPAGRVPVGNRTCDALLELTRGRKRAKQAWTDVGRFSQWGLDAVSFGPGFPEFAHRQDEHASIDAMHESLQIFERLLYG